MTYKERSSEQTSYHDPSDGWKEFLYALLLFKKGIEIHQDDWALVAQTTCSVTAELDIWSCRRVDDYSSANPYSFRRNIDGKRYQVDRKGTSLLIVQFNGLMAQGAISTEIRRQTKRSANLEIISSWDDNFDQSILRYFDTERVHLRAIVAEGTEQKGILLPREYGYRVLNSSFAPDGKRRDTLPAIELNDFILKSYTVHR